MPNLSSASVEPVRQVPIGDMPNFSPSLPAYMGGVQTTIVVLGEGSGLLETIQSALKLADEVLWVDDGSTGPIEGVAAISDPKFLIVRRPWRSGKARELGAAQASGREVRFVNVGEKP